MADKAEASTSTSIASVIATGLTDGKKAHRVTVPLLKCTCTSVCVFSDRAELTRTVEFTAEQGLNDLVINAVPSAVNENSVRVSGGTGGVTILEVATAITTPEACSEKTESDKCKEEVTLIEDKLKIIENKKKGIKQREEWLQTYLTEAIKPTKGAAPINVEEAHKYLDFHAKTTDTLQADLHRLEEEEKDLRTKLSVVQTQLAPTLSQLGQTQREITISMFSPKQTSVHLQFSYIIIGASWTPSYDVRVKSNVADFQLIYYGKIVNTTGEDWTNTRLSLSTAQPSVGGEPPKLFTVKVASNAYGSYNYGSARHFNVMNANVMMQQQQQHSSSVATSNIMCNDMDAVGGLQEQQQQQGVGVLTTTATQSVCATTFDIQHATTVASDKKPHKVTICILDLAGVHSCVCVPTLNNNAYLRVHSVNKSTYTLLAGETQVFVDNNFVTQSSIKLVNPGEKFHIYLGVDATVVVRRKPTNEKSSTSGMLWRAKVKDFSLAFTVKNTKLIPVAVHVYTPVPKSDDSNVKVTLKTPVLENNPQVKLNEFNNLDFGLDLKASQEESIGYSYTIEYPTNRELQFYN